MGGRTHSADQEPHTGGCTRVPGRAPTMLTKSHARGAAPESPALCTPSPAVPHAHSVRSPRGWQRCTSWLSVRLPVSVLGLSLPSEHVGSVVTASPCPHSPRLGDTPPPLSPFPREPQLPRGP